MDNLLKGCDIGFTANSLCIHAPHFESAKALRKAFRWVASQAATFNKNDSLIYYPGCDRPYQVPAKMAMNEEEREAEIKVQNESQLSLVGADYLRILEFLTEQRHEGNIVIITSNVTRDALGRKISTDNPEAGRDICYHTNDLLLPTRAHWTANQFTGYNYRLSWRRDQDDHDRLNPEYGKLKALLERDGCAPDYEYTLYRPDGAMCRYSTSYF